MIAQKQLHIRLLQQPDQRLYAPIPIPVDHIAQDIEEIILPETRPRKQRKKLLLMTYF